MALVTGGDAGVGLLISSELVAQGNCKVVAVSKHCNTSPSSLVESQLVEAILEIATFSHVKADISDAAAMSDAYTFCNGGWMLPLRELPSTSMHEDGPGQGINALDLLTALVAYLEQLVSKEAPIDDRRLNRVVYFRDSMSSTHQDSLTRNGPRPDKVWLRQFETKLAELTILVDRLRRNVRTAAELGLPAGGRTNPAEPAVAKPAPPRSREQPAGVGVGTLLDSMEEEITSRRGGGGAARGRGEIPGVGKESSAPARACSGCGRDAGPGRTTCFACSLRAECGGMEGAIRKAREEAARKAKREAERKEREDSERKARLEGERLAREREEAERRAEESRAREEAERKGKEEAEAAEFRASQEARRKLEQEALRQQNEDAVREIQEEAERKAAGDTLCPSGHVLQPFNPQRGFPCDVCEGEATGDVTMWGCRTRDAHGRRACDYDICEACRATAERRN